MCHLSPGMFAKSTVMPMKMEISNTKFQGCDQVIGIIINSERVIVHH
jgi:hypothetical protein